MRCATCTIAQACWLCANLYSDDVVEMNGMPGLEERASTLGAMAAAYGLSRDERSRFVRLMIDFAIHATANDAGEFELTPDGSTEGAAWALARRARSASWMLTHREVLEHAVRG